ncbi:MAG: hypothetical protein U0990_02435 [Candidatus Nanopelagicales bacterium]|nr:hypothetical protein [Candidatus Nanopelagicales bacterium]MDZ4248928.1 hypothetical protein [Candidatus Nanopelagicales bacterium]MDZ7576882.1 hypothetical protein [Candidatus Nanopelagicales bacterium]
MMNGIGKRGTGVLAAGALAVVLAGCSTVGGLLAPGEAGDAVVAAAVGDILLKNDVAILSGPVCKPGEVKKSLKCTGQTMDKKPIAAEATGTKEGANLKVTVGDKTLYDGPLVELLQKAMQGKP